MFSKSYCNIFQVPRTVSAEEVYDKIEVIPSDYYIKSDRVTDSVSVKKETLTGHMP